jgi:hypothetical protein
MPDDVSLTPEERPAQKAAYMKAWRAKNAAHVSTYNHTYHAAHADERHAYNKTYAAEHADAIDARTKSYRAANPDKVKAWDQAKRDRINADPVKREAKLAYDRHYSHTHRAKDNARQQAKYHEDIDTTHTKAKAKRERRREELLVYFRNYYEQTKEERHPLKLKNAQDFRDRHPGYYNDVRKRRRAQKLGAPRNDLTRAEWEEIKAHYGYRCVYCDRQMQRLEQDHITPLSKGGSHTKQNVVPCCRSCNSKKHAGPVLTPVQPLLL